MPTIDLSVPAGTRPSERTAVYMALLAQAKADHPGATIHHRGGNRLRVEVPDSAQDAPRAPSKGTEAPTPRKAPAQSTTAKKAVAKKSTTTAKKAPVKRASKKG